MLLRFRLSVVPTLDPGTRERPMWRWGGRRGGHRHRAICLLVSDLGPELSPRSLSPATCSSSSAVSALLVPDRCEDGA
ncbi:hypothetical protein PR202_gb00071 [Eleusine coracana subsp. coracana]|uniref:Uncharacterized protein n=1 Tax=Eleusine coracana subsp. coracana TaxID=191504 RepID=A0AAV5DTD3_ELECO|nr:hypothetical protein PR202_gb00071 [Eleusine coracana subsp. coracana]